MQRSNSSFSILLGATAAVFVALILFVFLRVPSAQLAAGGIAQKILYFHAPAAYCVYLSGFVCFLGSAAYLAEGTDKREAWARAGAECAVVFGLMVLVSGPLWAKKAWGVYWAWDPRLTSALLSVLIYIAIVVLRSFAGNGDAERRFAAALGVLGGVNLPIIHYSVKLWGGNHPTVITGQGGGLRHLDMRLALGAGFLAMTLLAAVLLWSRARLFILEARFQRAAERALAHGLIDDG